MSNKEKFFPERYSANRYYAKKMLSAFKGADFDPDFSKRIGDESDIDVLREFIRKPVHEWHEGSFLPDEILDERDDILHRMQKYQYELPVNPTADEYKKWSGLQKIQMQSQEWKEWSNWLTKAEEMIVVHRKLEQEVIVARDYIRFSQCGRNIFEITPFLLRLLEKTDVGDIRFRDFKLPYKTIYFHFGTLEALEYPVEYYEQKFDAYVAEPFNFETIEDEDEYYQKKKFLLDGAFISMTSENCIDIQLCFKDTNDSFTKNVNVVNDHRFPTFDFTLSFGKRNKDESHTEYDEETTFNESTVIFCDYWDEKAELGEIGYGKLSRLTNEPEKCFKSEWKEYVLMDKALKLIVNCICYLSANELDIEVFATNEQANEILEELYKASKTQIRNKLEKKLSKFSYSKVHLVGHKLKAYFDRKESDNEVEPHWRRGHWRKQPFGENLSETKLIWIKPTIVRKDKGEPKKGHVYNL
ncbi:hypothetical protein [Mangrovibacterium lignilyticum]|uniref:hypothetical protein n=1 Tax=Mangrovibacterium lignilyticum TaxID=2668052 RepID=UPI0013D28BE1|nr:hypothetical protein [Mangrovibacterium lignilyticum]